MWNESKHQVNAVSVQLWNWTQFIVPCRVASSQAFCLNVRIVSWKRCLHFRIVTVPRALIFGQDVTYSLHGVARVFSPSWVGDAEAGDWGEEGREEPDTQAIHGVDIHLVSCTHLSASISGFCERSWMVRRRVYFIFIIVPHITQEWRGFRQSLTYCYKTTSFNELESTNFGTWLLKICFSPTVFQASTGTVTKNGNTKRAKRDAANLTCSYVFLYPF